MELKLSGGYTSYLVLLEGDAVRMSNTCFRGTSVQKAGNLVWDNWAKLCQSDTMHQLISGAVEDALGSAPAKQKTLRVEVEAFQQTGWPSAIPIEELPPGVLEQCTKGELGNPKRTALFVPRGVMKAPKTHWMTLALEPRFSGNLNFLVRSIYPGRDCGELRKGNMTNKTGMVWFDWNHPGA